MMAGVRGRDVRIAFGSVAPTVVLAKQAAAVSSTAAARSPTRRRRCSTEITPIDDVRSTREYRARVAANLLAEFWSATT